MNPSIVALLELQVIDQQRQTLKKGREGKRTKLADAEKSKATADAAAVAAQAEVDRLGALVRQYHADIARCEATTVDLRAKQMNAKTNKDYMAIINSIEQAKMEKTLREQSIKEIDAKLAILNEKAAKAAEQAAVVAQNAAAMQTEAANAAQPGSEEAGIQLQYDTRKAAVDPAFLEVYERLVKANHKHPLLRVNPTTRATPLGTLISQNQIEQIRLGKLVIDRTSNSILFIDERPKG